MMTSVCSTSEYRIIIHFDVHFDPKVILEHAPIPVCVLYMTSQLGIQKTQQQYAYYYSNNFSDIAQNVEFLINFFLALWTWSYIQL